MLMNSTNKIVPRQEFLNNQELSNFSNYVMNKYSPNVIQNDCLVKTQENETKLTIEFTFNQKYGSDVVDLIFEPILVYNLSNSSSSSGSVNSSNLSPILQSDDMVELVSNNKILENVSFSTLLARLKLTSNQIITINTKYMIPLNFGILMSGFVVDTENLGTLKIIINITKTPSRQINLSDYNEFQLKYKSYITSKYKIKNSSNTIRLLNQYFSNPLNKKLLGEPVSYSIKNKIFIEPDVKLQMTQSAQVSQSIPVYKTTGSTGSSGFSSCSTIPEHKIQSLDIRKEPMLINHEPVLQNYSTIVNSLYSQMKKGYNYDNIQAFNSAGGDSCDDSCCGLVGQSLIDYEFNDEIEEYKKIDTSLDSQYFQKEKLFNKRISLFCDIAKELECLSVSNKNISFQTTTLTNLYLNFTTNNVNETFNAIRLKLNGKTIYEAEREMIFEKNNIYGSSQLYLIPINTTEINSSLNSLDTYELIFDGLTQPINELGIKLFEISKYICYYSISKHSPKLIKV